MSWASEVPELVLTVEFWDGELRETHHAHWRTLPKRPIRRLEVRQGKVLVEIQPALAAEIAIWDPPPRGPLQLFVLDHRGGKLWGRRWTFSAGGAVEVDVIDGQPLDAPGLPPRSLFIPGAFAEFVPPARRSSATAVRSRR